MKLPPPPFILRVLQLPLVLVVVLGIVLLALLNILPETSFATNAAFTLSLIFIIAFFWSGANMLTLIFVIYVILVFLVAYPSGYSEEGATIFLFIMFGFGLGRTINILGRSRVLLDAPYILKSETRRVPRILKIGVLMKLLCLVALLVTYGPKGFYSGAYLVNAIQNYAAGSSSGLVINAAGYLAAILCISGIAIYVKHGRASPLVVTLVLIGLPLITLERGNFVSGALCIVYIYRKQFRLQYLALLALSAIVVTIFFGDLREKQIGGSGSSGLSIIGAVSGELSVSLGMHLVVDAVHQRGVVGGKSLLGPIITMPIPRSLFPEKPLLTSAEVATKYFPSEAESGFYLATTIFGDWFYNFGIPGIVLVSAGLGYLIRRIDKGAASFLGIVVSYSIFSILRSNTAQSFLFIAACLFALQMTRVKIVSRSTKSWPLAKMEIPLWRIRASRL